MLNSLFYYILFYFILLQWLWRQERWCAYLVCCTSWTIKLWWEVNIQEGGGSVVLLAKQSNHRILWHFNPSDDRLYMFWQLLIQLNSPTALRHTLVSQILCWLFVTTEVVNINTSGCQSIMVSYHRDQSKNVSVSGGNFVYTYCVVCYKQHLHTN